MDIKALLEATDVKALLEEYGLDEEDNILNTQEGIPDPSDDALVNEPAISADIDSDDGEESTDPAVVDGDEVDVADEGDDILDGEDDGEPKLNTGDPLDDKEVDEDAIKILDVKPEQEQNINESIYSNLTKLRSNAKQTQMRIMRLNSSDVDQVKVLDFAIENLQK